MGTRHDMPWDIAAAFPWAKSVLLLVWAYLPFPSGERISSYYLAGHAAYRAAKEVCGEVGALGFRCEHAVLPARALAGAAGVGAVGRNGLLSIAPYGTRISLYTLATDACEPLAGPLGGVPCPAGCDLCARACPGGAISDHGLNVKKCIRFAMGSADHPDYIKAIQRTFMGCEVCQSVCPKNALLPVTEPPEEARAAFALRRLIAGDTAAARALVGRNISSNGKLTAEAIVFAARNGLYEQEIAQCLSSPFPAVTEAARWALNRFEANRSKNIMKV